MDLIERQVAIDAANRTDYIGLAVEDVKKVTDAVIEELKRLPSTQPEIVRCKDCEYYGCILYSGTQFEYGECFSHEESDYTFEVKPDDFCSRSERRTDEGD